MPSSLLGVFPGKKKIRKIISCMNECESLGGIVLEIRFHKTFESRMTQGFCQGWVVFLKDLSFG
jgi:hypothetical protein